MAKENFSLKWSSSNSVKNFANFFDGISRNPWNLIMKLGHLKDFSSSKDVCISQDKKVLLHKQAIFSTFNNKMAADSLHFIIYCFSVISNFHLITCFETIEYWGQLWNKRSYVKDLTILHYHKTIFASCFVVCILLLANSNNSFLRYVAFIISWERNKST